jgi:hypothetical protein
MAYTGSNREETKPRITSWSFSSLKTWIQCPLKAKLTRIDRLKEPESPAMVEGQRLHLLAENYLNHKIAEVPHELKLFAEDYRALREHGEQHPGTVFAEMGAAFREDLTVCDWWAKDAWMRAKLDVLILNDDDTAVVLDLKTGKPRRDDKDQLSMFAFAVMLLFPDVKEVRTELWYSTGGELVNGHFKREGIHTGFEFLKQEWLGKAAPMLADTEFLPIPSPLCAWCSFSKLKGGPCTVA